MYTNKSTGQYEVLSPWAEANPIPLKRLAPRQSNLSGKRIGLIFNYKRASRPMLTIIQNKLKEKYSGCEFTWYSNMRPGVSIIESPDKGEFVEWLKKVDAVIGAVGD